MTSGGLLLLSLGGGATVAGQAVSAPEQMSLGGPLLSQENIQTVQVRGHIHSLSGKAKIYMPE